MKLSIAISIPTILFAIVLGGYMFESKSYGPIFFYPLFVSLIILVVVYLMQPQIDWWWSLRNPPEMPPPLEMIIKKTNPFYNKLDDIEKKRFRDRVMMWVMAKEMIPMSMEVFPEEFKIIIASRVVMMTFGMEKYLLNPYERVVLYPHAFPSPKMKFLHSSETHHEDGVCIFDLERMMMGINKIRENYDLVIHEYAGVIIKIMNDADFPTYDESHYEKLKAIRGFDIHYANKFIGLENLDINVNQLGIEHFFISPTAFKDTFPQEFVKYTQIFNLNPLNGSRPVINIKKIGEHPLKGE